MTAAKNIRPEVCAVVDADGAVLLDLGNGKYYSLNGIGGVIWQQLAAATAASEIAIHLVDVYGISLPDAEQDVAEFVSTLERAGLLNAND